MANQGEKNIANQPFFLCKKYTKFDKKPKILSQKTPQKPIFLEKKCKNLQLIINAL
jgi:hypothetical protein